VHDGLSHLVLPSGYLTLRPVFRLELIARTKTTCGAVVLGLVELWLLGRSEALGGAGPLALGFDLAVRGAALVTRRR
jgi:hypothetical protein